MPGGVAGERPMKAVPYADLLIKASHEFLARMLGRGRDGSYLPPPAQIRTCGTTAYGSCLGCVTRSDPQGKDVHFWV